GGAAGRDRLDPTSSCRASRLRAARARGPARARASARAAGPGPDDRLCGRNRRPLLTPLASRSFGRPSVQGPDDTAFEEESLPPRGAKPLHYTWASSMSDARRGTTGEYRFVAPCTVQIKF